MLQSVEAVIQNKVDRMVYLLYLLLEDLLMIVMQKMLGIV
jgi:hypothetical protein